MTVTADRLRRATVDYLAARPDQAGYLAPVLSLLEQGVDLAPRAEWRGHATVSAVLLDPDQQQVLFLAHAAGPWKWRTQVSRPGGHLEDVDDTLEQAVARELRAKLGLDPQDVTWLLEGPVHLDLRQIPASETRGEPSHLHIDYCYLGQISRFDYDLPEEEIAGVHWRPVASFGNPGLGAAVRAVLDAVEPAARAPVPVVMYSSMSAAAKARLLAQRPQCEICGTAAVEVDHDHVSGLVRGVLCRRCNGWLGSLEAALRLPEASFQSLAADLHWAFADSGSVQVARRDLDYLGLTREQYTARLRRVHEQLVLHYVYWTEVTGTYPGRGADWTKIGPLSDVQEARRHRDRLLATPFRELWVRTTREPDDGVNSPHPRCLVGHHATQGAADTYRELRGPVSMDAYDAKNRDFLALAVPVLLSRPLTAQQIRATRMRHRHEQVPRTVADLRALIGDHYGAGWRDLAVQIAVEDLGEDLPDPRWRTPSTARWHWRAVCAAWLDRRDGQPT